MKYLENLKKVVEEEDIQFEYIVKKAGEKINKLELKRLF